MSSESARSRRIFQATHTEPGSPENSITLLSISDGASKIAVGNGSFAASVNTQTGDMSFEGQVGLASGKTQISKEVAGGLFGISAEISGDAISIKAKAGTENGIPKGSISIQGGAIRVKAVISFLKELIKVHFAIELGLGKTEMNQDGNVSISPVDVQPIDGGTETSLPFEQSRNE